MGIPLQNRDDRTGGVMAIEKLEHITAEPQTRTAPLAIRSNAICRLSFFDLTELTTA